MAFDCPNCQYRERMAVFDNLTDDSFSVVVSSTQPPRFHFPIRGMGSKNRPDGWHGPLLACCTASVQMSLVNYSTQPGYNSRPTSRCSFSNYTLNWQDHIVIFVVEACFKIGTLSRAELRSRVRNEEMTRAFLIDYAIVRSFP